MAKTAQQGYYKLGDQWLHFSMNAWINLKQDRGVDVTTALMGFQEMSPVDQTSLISDIVWAAATAYNQENDIDESISIYKVRNWMTEFDDSHTTGLIDAMLATINTNDEGKKKAKK